MRSSPSTQMLAPTTTTTRSAPAKVNLCLRIVGRRADGYHLLDSVFAAIDLIDRCTISIDRCGVDDGRPNVTLSCAFPGVPSDESNLAFRAAAAFLDATNICARIHISIEKRIPPGAGLGGGSSNAATVLAALNEANARPLSHADLATIALSLGADVPFFLTGGCARVRGIGERVESIPGWPGHELVLALPPVAVSTAWAFRNRHGEIDSSSDEPARLSASRTIAPALLRNDLEDVVLKAYPAVEVTKRGLLDAGAVGVVMSGSGSSVLAICGPPGSADGVRERFVTAHPQTTAYTVRILGAPIG